MSNLRGDDDVNMQSLVEAMQQQIAQMQAMIATQTAQLADQTPVVNVEKRFSKKVEIIADPGQYAGEKAKFIEWWTKMKIWVRANNNAFSNSFELCTVVWSHLTRPNVGRYTQTRMVECLNADHWPRDTELIEEVESFFLPQNERDWARSQIQTCKQGNLRVDEYVSKWLSLFRQSKISDEHGVYLLETNTSARIIKQVFMLGVRADTIIEYIMITRIQNIGQAQEAYLMFQPTAKTQGRAWGNNASGSKTYGGQGELMDIGAATKGRGAGSSECYKCGKGGHFAPNCKAPNCQCGSNRHTSKRHPAGQGKGKGRESQADFKQMDFEEAKAFFYDMQVAELKSQGKGFGP
ncbi:hypothetical protein HYDPIDRAFT_102496 [Hydnomerulius pinastri MD-312]|uniref:CCHC-type domain-containing protein n=1 Tax=Hydnomerulius pinastri MD-312 TaxID=994086 RepID=A0A0C9W7Q2_9AGAM|nr:hypothetical protein HYDPIDRAFT_102496 [Hydnomerulius pinastri MD-312]